MGDSTELRLMFLISIAAMTALAIFIWTRTPARTDRDRCNDNTNTTWRCDTEVIFVPSMTDGGIIYSHRETRDDCRCQKGW